MGFSLEPLLEVTKEKFASSPGNVLAVRDGFEGVKIGEK